MQVVWVSVAKMALRETERASGNEVGGNCSVKLARMVGPVYPEEALRYGIRGTVVVKVLVDKEGLPRSVHTVRGDSILARAVCDAVQQWRWKPYRLKRFAVAVETTIAVSFEPDDAAYAPKTSCTQGNCAVDLFSQFINPESLQANHAREVAVSNQDLSLTPDADS